MVSLQNVPDNRGGVASVPVSDRGMTAEEPVVYQVQPQLRTRDYVAWGAVIGGSLLAIALFILSSSFGYACGVPAFQGGAYGWGAGIWCVITAGIAFFAAGWLTGCLMAGTDARFTALGGLLSWALAIPLMYLLFSGTFGGNFIHSLIGSDISRMTLQGSPAEPTYQTQTGAAWGAFISLGVGMIAALIGGLAGSLFNVTKVELPASTGRLNVQTP